MAGIGRFRNDAARERYMRAYEALAASWSVPRQTVDVPTSFGTTHVHRWGSGSRTPIVLLHPIGGSGLYWRDVAAQFGSDRVVYAPDTIGTAGRSVQTAPVRREADFAVWLNEVLDGLGVERVHVVGYSHGAWHAGAVALHDASRLDSVTLIEPGGVFVKPSWRVLMKMLSFGMRGKSEENMRRIAEWLTPGVTLDDLETAYAKEALSYRMKIGWARLLTDAEIRSISVPTLVIFAAETIVTDPGAAVRRLAEHLPQAETEIYPGVGHGLLNQIPEKVTRRVLEFVRRHDRIMSSSLE
ncbi:alpha/beta fold hydrolase [Nocardia higoensis]|uniref:Alpha/beta fold hydrolase n=1 Tax=Nocardia higoensis TaxID=228599 RepID=A0ABS0D6A4_9NOCA|nr:alpha/beta fold hydrolase [Nocardia higoensis]MBF6354004.1 alpha/beta fold hydrolase [Nocardia higoensis]